MSKSFCIYGASGHSKVIIEIIEKAGDSVKGVFDDDPRRNVLLDYKVTNERSIFELKDVEWIIGIGNNEIRKKVAEKNLLSYGLVIDTEAIVSASTKMGMGTVVMPGSTINSSTVIGKHVIINTNSSVDHDSIIRDYVHISPNATLCGGIQVGEGTHIGASAVVIPGIKIGKWAIIGAGSVIINDVPDFATVVGNPGQIIKIKDKL
jgi:acetyltransferase EpsM